MISPGHLTSNPRLVKEADALTAAGHAVVVISGWSFPPLVSDDWRFAKRAWSDWRQVPYGALAPPWRRQWQRLRQRLARLIVNIGVRWPALVIRAWHPAGVELIHAAKSVCADLYIAHYPAALPAAALAARAHAARYGFDAEDFHLGDWPEEPSYDRQRRLLRSLESTYLPGCAYITAASPGIAQAYADSYGIALPAVLRNVFPLCQAPPGPTHRGTASPGPSLYWFSQTIGPDRGLEAAVRALAQARCHPHLYLRGFISDTYRRILIDIAVAEGVSEHLHILPPAPPEQLERLAAAYDLGLVAETGCTPNRRIALTNKLFSYALAGIPAVITDIPAHRAFAKDAGVAVHLYAVDDAMSLATAIDNFCHPQSERLADARAHAFALAQNTLNWDHEQRLLTQLVECSLGT